MKNILFTLMAAAMLLVPFAHAQAAAPGYDYQYVGQSSHVSLYPGQSTVLWVKLKNTGSVTWDRGVFRLGTANQQDRSSVFMPNTANTQYAGRTTNWLSANRIVLEKQSVVPSEVSGFGFYVTVPVNQAPGVYREYFRPVVDGMDWLKDIGMYWDITVLPNPTGTSTPVSAQPQVGTPVSTPNTPIVVQPNVPVATTPTPTTAWPTVTPRVAAPIALKGDMDKNGVLNYEDLTLLSRMSIGVVAPDLSRGDMDGDGLILNNDVVLLSRSVANAVIKGDVNRDGKIDNADLTHLARMSVALEVVDLARGDMDSDGQILVNDVVLLSRSIANSVIKGDVNRDGKIDNADLLFLSRMSVALEVTDIERGDISGDGTIQVNDVVLLAQMVRNTVIKGDVNRDGKIDHTDLTYLSRMSIGLEQLDLSRGDIDGDGTIQVNDVVLLSRSIANSIIKGDVNRDGKIDYADLVYLSRMSVGLEVMDLARGDMDNDGLVMNNDVVLLSKSVANSVIKGDVNRDGKIDRDDLLYLSRMSIGLEHLDLSRGDIDGDGQVLINDVVLLQRSIK